MIIGIKSVTLNMCTYNKFKSNKCTGILKEIKSMKVPVKVSSEVDNDITVDFYGKDIVVEQYNN